MIANWFFFRILTNVGDILSFSDTLLEKIGIGNLKVIEKLRKIRHEIDSDYSRWLISQVLQKIDSSFEDSNRSRKVELLLFLDITRVRETIDRYFALNNPKKTEFCYHRILASLDKMQAGQDIFTRRSLLNSYLDTYQRIIAFALKRRNLNRVFFYTEIFRNRYLVERLSQQDVPLPETVPSQLSQAIQQAQQRERKALQIYTNGISDNLPEQQLEKFAQQWDDEKEAIEKLYIEVAAIEPEFIAKTKVTPLSYSKVQHSLPSDTAILEFFFTKNKLLTMLILPGEESPRIPEALSLPLLASSLENIAQAWVRELSSKSKFKQDKEIEQSQQNLDSRIDKISDSLNFSKLLEYIPNNIEHLIVVPNNYLHLFPIHALWVNKQENKRLIDYFSVSYFSSLQVWKICQKRQRPKQSLIGIENPTQDKDLIFAKAEMASICQRQQFTQRQILTGKNASKRYILNTATNHHCFHFSGHAEYNFENPLDSYLMLSDEDEENRAIATTCLSKYYSQPIDPEKLIADEFLGSPFYLYLQPVTFQQFNDYSVESIQLACVFLYQDEATEGKADKVYLIFQYLLLSYHKIKFFYSQSLVLKSLLEEQYKNIECLTEDYARQKWDSQSLKKIPQESLRYYQRLAFLEDQAKLVEVNLKNYQECLQQIAKKTGQTSPKFFINFERDIVFYLEQIKADIGFLSPALHLYEKLMLSVQTQVGIDEAEIQEIQNLRQAQLGQIFAGIGTAIALGQILTQPITTTISQKLEPTQNTPSLTSLWLGASASIVISLFIGYLISIVAYRWLIKD